MTCQTEPSGLSLTVTIFSSLISACLSRRDDSDLSPTFGIDHSYEAVALDQSGCRPSDLAVIDAIVRIIRVVLIKPDLNGLGELDSMLFEVGRCLELIPLKSLFQLNPILLLPNPRSCGEDSSELR